MGEQDLHKPDPENQYQLYRSKSELVKNKAGAELTPTTEYVHENPMKTAPNRLTTKPREDVDMNNVKG